MLSMETIIYLKEFAKKLSIKNYEFREKPFYLNSDNKMNYTLIHQSKELKNSNFISAFIGTNPRHEATMLNARIRKVFVSKEIPIISFGDPGDLTYDYTNAGNSTEDIKKLLNKENETSKIL